MVIALGLIASVLVIMMSITVQRKNIVLLSIIMAVITSFQYLLLGEIGTVWLGAVSLIYAVAMSKESTFPFVKTWAFSIVTLIAYATGYFWINGFSPTWGLLALTASLIGTFMLRIHNPLTMKWAMLFNGLTWLTYQLAVGAYGQLPGEAVYLVGIVVSLSLLNKAKNKGVNLLDVPEFMTIVKNKFATQKALA